MHETPARSAKFGPFEVLSRIGVGGMGEVFRARMVLRGAPIEVALKLIRPDHTAQERFRRMFEAEAKISALLRHPKIVQLHDFGEVDGVPYLAMELVDGVSLDQLLLDGPLQPEVAAFLACELLDALSFVHNLTDERRRPLKLVHRDVSPSNLLISQSGDVKLTDFGVARLEGAHLTATDEVKGKRSYMAPEQLEGGELDGRTDLFSVGVVLHRMAAGAAPFRDIEDFVGRPSGRVDGSFTEVLWRALRHKPEDRFATAEEFAAKLREQAADPEDARAILSDRVRQAQAVERPLARLDRVILARLDRAGDEQPPDLGGTASMKAQPARRKTPRWLLAAVAAASALAIAAVAFATLRRAPVAAAPATPRATAVVAGPPQIPPPAAPAPPAPPPSPAAVTRRASDDRVPPRRVRVAALAGEVGYLSLDTDPWATAYLGARKLGTTPFVHVALPPGTHKLSLDVEGSGRRQPLRVTVASGAESRVRKRLR